MVHLFFGCIFTPLAQKFGHSQVENEEGRKDIRRRQATRHKRSLPLNSCKAPGRVQHVAVVKEGKGGGGKDKLGFQEGLGKLPDWD